MPKRKKDLKQKLSEFTYSKPSMDKRLLGLKKNFGEIVSMLNDKNKK